MIIGIAGGTGSGKTTVVKKIMLAFPKNDVVMLSEDNYYKDNRHLSDQEKRTINFDHPEAIEFDLLIEHIKMLKEGKSVTQPSYSYLTCMRSEGEKIFPQKVIIVEGILVLNHPVLRDLFDVKVFVDAPPDERLIRVIRRDIIERGRDVNEVLKRYEETLRPMHEQFIEPTKQYADIILPNGGHNHVAIKLLCDIIKNKLSDPH